LGQQDSGGAAVDKAILFHVQLLPLAAAMLQLITLDKQGADIQAAQRDL
jgi:hypothetical protein